MAMVICVTQARSGGADRIQDSNKEAWVVLFRHHNHKCPYTMLCDVSKEQCMFTDWYLLVHLIESLLTNVGRYKNVMLEATPYEFSTRIRMASLPRWIPELTIRAGQRLYKENFTAL